MEQTLDVEQPKFFLRNIHDRAAASWVDDGSNLRAVAFEFVHLVDLFREVGEDELVELRLAAVDDFLEHPHDQARRDVFVLLHYLDELLPNVRASLHFVVHKLQHVQVYEVVVFAQVHDYFLLQLVGFATSHVDDAGLN